MKKTVLFPCVLLLMLVSCHQKQEQKNIDVPEPQETVVLDGVYHFNFDGFELWTLQDVQRKMSADLFKDAKKADIKQFMPDGEADAAINTFLIKKNGKYILFDTGLGLEKGGVMLDKLTLLNLRPEDISTICITHCHGDHIGGLVSKGEPVFPNAEVYCSDKELNAFKNDALTKEVVKIYDSRLHAFAAGDTLLGEIRSIAAYGHTPGHTFYQIGNLLIVGDQTAHLNDDAFFWNIVFREVAHGLGVKETVNGKGTVAEALGNEALLVEEIKGNVVGLYLACKLIDEHRLSGIVTKEDALTTFVASLVRSERFGEGSALGRANIIIYNYLVETGAIARNEAGRYVIDYAQAQSSIMDLASRVLGIQATGDREGAAALEEQYGKLSLVFKGDLRNIRLEGIPADIRFEFEK